MKLNRLYELFYTKRDRERKLLKNCLALGVFLLLCTAFTLYVVGNFNNSLAVFMNILIVFMILFLIVVGVFYTSR